jgi:hypothetical protein
MKSDLTQRRQEAQRREEREALTQKFFFARLALLGVFA